MVIKRIQNAGPKMDPKGPKRAEHGPHLVPTRPNMDPNVLANTNKVAPETDVYGNLAQILHNSFNSNVIANSIF